MRRREVLGALLFVAGGKRAEAQNRPHRIAVVHGSALITEMTEAGGHPGYRGFFAELKRLGYLEGSNLAVGRYTGAGRTEHYVEVARYVVQSNPDLVVASSNRLVRPFKEATTTIPIVGLMAAPVEAGLVANLARPEGNITGVTVDAGPELYGKRLELF